MIEAALEKAIWHEIAEFVVKPEHTMDDLPRLIEEARGLFNRHK